MSCFIIQDQSINRILTGIFFIYENDLLKYEIQKVLKEYKINYDPKNDNNNLDKLYKVINKMGLNMKKLNHKSFNYNYSKVKHIEKDNLKDLKFYFQQTNTEQTKNNKIQLIKSLSCFLYQSCEGSQDQTPLYKLLRDLENKFKTSYIYNCEEFNTAKWE